MEDIFSTEGRLNRLKFFTCSIGLLLALSILTVVFMMIFGESGSVALITVSRIIFAIGMVILSVRRLHDLNKSGSWALIGFIPLINLLFFLYLTFAKGTNGANDYGDDPLVK